MVNDIHSAEGAPLRSILILLADGQFHSGEELGLLLGVSRAAVWKHLQKLESLGIKVHSTKGRGYCIEGGLDLLDKQTICSLAHCVEEQELRLDVFSSIDSTNAYLLGLPDAARHICLAEMQTAGRGRRGRPWVSPYAQNVYLSLGWGFDGGIAGLSGLSLAVGVAIVHSLQKQGLEGIELKWPNDVLCDGKKLAGILVEMVGDPSGYCQVVIGIGVNVSMSELAAENIDQPWIDLRSIAAKQHTSTVSRNYLVAALISGVTELLVNYPLVGFMAYQQRWELLNAYANQHVTLHNGNQSVTGLMLGVTVEGALRLQTERGVEVFHGGELSLRIAS